MQTAQMRFWHEAVYPPLAQETMSKTCVMVAHRQHLQEPVCDILGHAFELT